MGLAEAEKMFRNQSLNFVVSDSTYVEDLPAGSIVDYTPSAGQKVKEGRTIYLTINTLDIPLQVIPDVADNSSVRQAEARLLASGFKLDEVQYVPGEQDWVYGVKYHDANGDVQAYTKRAYLSIPLRQYAVEGVKKISVHFSLNTYASGIKTYTFDYIPH